MRDGVDLNILNLKMDVLCFSVEEGESTLLSNASQKGYKVIVIYLEKCLAD